MEKFHVTDIKWCVEWSDVDDASMMDDILGALPVECDIECEDIDEIADALSDKYGFLVESFCC